METEKQVLEIVVFIHFIFNTMTVYVRTLPFVLITLSFFHLKFFLSSLTLHTSNCQSFSVTSSLQSKHFSS